MTPEELLYVHVTGTDQTTTLTREAVRAAVAQGQIRQSQLIWSPADNAWKPVRELPDLLPKPSVAPIPSTPKPAVAAVKPKVAVTMKAGMPVVATTPRVSAAARAGMKTGRSVVVEDADEGTHIIRWICVGLGLLIAALVGVNYFLVDKPLVTALAQTDFPKATVFAHLGAFLQPKAIVIHLSPSSAITRDNLPDFLVALAKSTPPPPLGGNVFDRVCLTTGLTSRYTFSGEDWRQLSEMDGESTDHRKAFILEEAGDAGGASIVPPPVRVAGKYVDQHETAWSAFVDYFTTQ